MAINMNVLMGSLFTVSRLIEGVRMTFIELTGCEPPEITVDEWVYKDLRRPMSDHSLILSNGLMHVNFKNREASVLLTVDQDLDHNDKLSCDIAMACYRSRLEFALGAACAIWIARSQGTFIEDNWSFWTETVEIMPDDLAKIIRVHGSNDLETACRQLLGDRYYSSKE